MIDVDTFVTVLYVMIDDFGQAPPQEERAHPGPPAALSRAEVVTLAVFGQWVHFPSERAFYRYAERNLRAAFPTLPDRAQVNRLMRSHRETITAFGLYLVQVMRAQECSYEALESTAAVTGEAKRRGIGWLAGQAEIGWCNRLGWSEGFHLLLAVNPIGVITGFGFGSASTHDQPLAETLFAARQDRRLGLTSAGLPAHAPYVADKGFAGETPHHRWRVRHQAEVITVPHQTSRLRWPKALRRWVASLRQISETVTDNLLTTFRLARERPHDLTGFQARVAAKVSLHNFCLWLNGQLQRPPLAFADLIDW